MDAATAPGRARSGCAPDWLTGFAAGRALGVSPDRLPRVAPKLGVRRLLLPGRPARYHAGDVARLVATYTRPGEPVGG
jgi:hypothetical protein